MGLGLLGGQGFIGAKASLDSLCRALWHRALVWLLLKKQGNSTFAKVVKLQGRGETNAFDA